MTASRKITPNKSEPHPELKLAEGGAWSTSEMLRRGFTSATLDRGRRRFQLAYWTDRFGGHHYPKWQFDRSMKLLPAVAEILGIFRTHDTMRVLSWFVFPATPGSKSLLDLIRSGRSPRAVALVRKDEELYRAEPPLSKSALATLNRRAREFADRTRYVIASCWTRKCGTFYDLERDVFLMGEIDSTCLLRKREHAEAIAASLNGRNTCKLFRHHVVAVKKTPRGIRVLDRVPDPYDPKKRIRPAVRASRDPGPPLLVPIAPPGTRAHLADGFLFATDNREAVTALIAGAGSRPAARRILVRQCRMSPTQADAILDLRFWQLSEGSRSKWEAELRASVR